MSVRKLSQAEIRFSPTILPEGFVEAMRGSEPGDSFELTLNRPATSRLFAALRYAAHAHGREVLCRRGPESKIVYCQVLDTLPG